MSATLRAAGIASALIAGVNAHGYVQGVIYKGEWIQGYNPSFQYQNPPPVVAGWSDPENLGNGFVAPDQYATTNITCHLDATPGKTHLNVTAGDTVTLSWTAWPSSHVGPMLTYLANCNGECESVNKDDLEFFKIDELGLIDPTAASGSIKWASDLMISQNNSWDVTIPTGIATGNYVMRHETIALHSAGTADGAQNYPYCVNFAVTSDGTDKPAAEAATSFYKEDDAGILINVYQSLTTYDIPGPTLWSGAAKNPNPTSGGSGSVSSAAPTTSAVVSASASASISGPPSTTAEAASTTPESSYTSPSTSAETASTTPASSYASPSSSAEADSTSEDSCDEEPTASAQAASIIPSSIPAYTALSPSTPSVDVSPVETSSASSGSSTPYPTGSFSHHRGHGTGRPHGTGFPYSTGWPSYPSATGSINIPVKPFFSGVFTTGGFPTGGYGGGWPSGFSTAPSSSGSPTVSSASLPTSAASPSEGEGEGSSESDWLKFLQWLESSIKKFIGSHEKKSKRAITRRHAREYVR